MHWDVITDGSLEYENKSKDLASMVIVVASSAIPLTHLKSKVLCNSRGTCMERARCSVSGPDPVHKEFVSDDLGDVRYGVEYIFNSDEVFFYKFY